jgi:23S rRNA pseudouridine955/2504/2580 synthase
VPFIGLQKAIRTGVVKVNGRKVAPDYRLQGKDVVTLPPLAAAMTTQAAAAKPTFKASATDLAQLKAMVVHQDNQVLILNKPQGLPSQAGGGIVKSLDRLLAAAYGPEKTPKLVHRLDKETSGIMVCAKNRTTAAALGAQWAGRGVVKAYMALVLAPSLPARGDCKEPLTKVGPLAKVQPGGDSAHTSWVRLAEVKSGVWAVLAYPRTGRMNQIRAHFAHHAMPLVGDDKYGPFAQTKPMGQALGTGLALHAWQVQFVHPLTAQVQTFMAPLPKPMQTLMPEGSRALELAAQAWQRWAQEKET